MSLYPKNLTVNSRLNDSFFQRYRSLAGYLQLLLLLFMSCTSPVALSQAAPQGPAWWYDEDQTIAVINNSVAPDEVDHNAIANLGQAKWMAYRALITLKKESSRRSQFD